MFVVGVVAWRKTVKCTDLSQDRMGSFIAKLCYALCYDNTTASEALPCVIIEFSYAICVTVTHLPPPAPRLV